jgi:DNA-directed RNA polymerase subunit L
VKEEIKDLIESAAISSTPNPRDETEGNLKLLYVTVLIALLAVQDLYGIGDETELHPHPIFGTQPQSQIVPLKGNHGTVAVLLGEYVKTWEDVFYDICHESLHLLNPTINVKSDNVKVSALEEGCAVKFAEQMYEQHIKPYCNKTPLTSPVTATASQYFSAYSAVKKIPDDVLKEVRRKFERFSKIDDFEKFKELVGEYVSDQEIDVLVRTFTYS